MKDMKRLAFDAKKDLRNQFTISYLSDEQKEGTLLGQISLSMAEVGLTPNQVFFPFCQAYYSWSWWIISKRQSTYS